MRAFNAKLMSGDHFVPRGASTLLALLISFILGLFLAAAVTGQSPATSPLGEETTGQTVELDFNLEGEK